MTTLTNFFKHSDSTLGVFYPTHYIIATFPEFAKAKEAEQALRCLGFGDDELLALQGSEILQYFAEFRADSGMWADAMKMFSRGFGTEQLLVDADLCEARKGAGFLAIYSPSQAVTTSVQSTLKRFDPIAMHWYHTAAVESLI